MFIRAVHKGQKKKIKASDKPSFEFLQKELVRCFGEAAKSAAVGYYDEDQEFIRLTNDEDWEICIEEAQFKNKGRDVITVEVHVLPGDESSEEFNNTKSFIVAPMLETTKSEIDDWRVIDKQNSSQMDSMEQEPLLDANESKITQQEPSIFEESAFSEPEEIKMKSDETQIPKYTNETQDDVLIDMKFTGKPEELERIQKSIIHQFAPHAGFEIERCEVLTKRSQPDEVEHEDNDSVFEGSQMSHMSTQLKDEIESLIEEKLKKLSLFREEESNFSKKTTPKVISCGNYNHGCVTCDNCQRFISGCARYKSLVKYDYDLCETCEAKGIHPEPMIKIRNPIGHHKGMKLNSAFDYLSNLFRDQPNPIICERPASTQTCNTEDKIALIKQAEKALKESVAQPAKMSEEPVPKPKPALCHIRKALPKFEEKTAESKPTTPEFPSPISKPEVSTFINHPMLNDMARMFPNLDTRVINEFLNKNTGLTYEEILNRFLDMHI